MGTVIVLRFFRCLIINESSNKKKHFMASAILDQIASFRKRNEISLETKGKHSLFF